MILDRLENSDAYKALHPLLGEAFAFLKGLDPKSLQPGRIILKDDNLFAIVAAYTPQEKENPRYESHEQYLDVQYMLHGSEYQWYAHRSQLTQIVPYQQEKDVTFYSFTENGTCLKLQEGDFALYFPQDGHLPSMPDAVAKECIRVVVKIKC